jgi:hypothetical protein
MIEYVLPNLQFYNVYCFKRLTNVELTQGVELEDVGHDRDRR